MIKNTHFEYSVTRVPLRDRLIYQARILRVLSRTDFKLKYAGSVLGYVWSATKPLLYFTILWIVFRSLFRSGIHNYSLYLITGVVLWTFVADAVSATLPSIVSRASILRRISFPPIVIPVAATLTAVMTFLINLLIVIVFIAANRIEPRLQWLLLIPLFVELYLFVLGVCLIVAILYVRFRDIAQIWEVAASALFFAAPIMYPVTLLPPWARHIVVFNPFVQILQDTRRIILGADAHAVRLIGFHGNHLIPLTVILALLLGAFWLYRRNAPYFAELA
jgi:ABC-2 type transport system permease protein